MEALLYHLPILFLNFPRRLNHPGLLVVASLDHLFFHFFLLVPSLLGKLYIPVHMQKQSISDGIVDWRSQLEKTFDGDLQLDWHHILMFPSYLNGRKADEKHVVHIVFMDSKLLR